MFDRARVLVCTCTALGALTLTASTFGQGCGTGGDCCIANPGTTGCLDIDCCTTVCALDAFCCDTEWDQTCADAALVNCVLCGGGGGGGGCGTGGDCCVANPGTLGCMDVDCCTAVCAADAYCCTTEWDQICADEAATMCAACIVPCTPPAFNGSEVELCGEDLNGGCNGGGTEPCALGSIISGTGWADLNMRDTDWYYLSLAESTEVTLSIYSTGAYFTAIVDLACGGIVGAASAGACPSTTTVCLPVGDYYVVALPSVFAGFPCATGDQNNYTLEISGVPCVATPPANDTCATATVAIEGANPFDNTFANTDWGLVSCGFGGAPFLKEVFFSFTATQSGDYQVETCFGSAPFDTGIEVYDACPELGGVQIACNDDGAGCLAFSSSLYFTATAGTTYTILVGGWNGATGATEMNIVFVGNAPSCGDVGLGDCCLAGTTAFCADFDCCTTVCGVDAFCCDTMWDQACADLATQLCTACGGSSNPPANDECAAAIVAVEGANPFANALATDSWPTPTCGFGAAPFLKDVFFTFTPAVDGAYVFETCSGSAPFDTGIDIWDMCPELGGTMLFCNDDGAGCTAFSSYLDATLTAGVTYTIRVGGWNGAIGATELMISVGGGGGGGPANDNCADATAAIVGSNPFDTTGATTDGATTCAPCYNDVWMSFTPAASSSFTFSLCGGSTWDTRLDIFADCLGTSVACNDDYCGLQSQVDAVALVGGTTYLVRLGSYGLAGGAGTLIITDNGGGGGGGTQGQTCENPLTLAMGDNAFNRAGCTVDLDFTGYCDMGPYGTEFNYNCEFFTFTAAENGTYTFSTCNLATHDTRLSCQATCDVTTVLGCNDDGTGCASFTSIMTVDLLCDTTYIIAVGGYSATTVLGTGTLNVSVVNNTPCSVPCPGDFDSDGTIGGADLSFLLANWGGPGADLDADGLTGGSDLAFLLGVFGTTCP